MSRTYRKPTHVFHLNRGAYAHHCENRNKHYFAAFHPQDDLNADAQRAYVEREIQSDLADYDKWHRDNRYDENLKKRFRHLSRKLVRSKNRQEMRRYMKEDREDYRVFDDHDGKKFIWAVW